MKTISSDIEIYFEQLVHMDGLIIHEKFIGEFHDLIRESGNQIRIMKKLVTLVAMMQNIKPEVLCTNSNFENLKEYHNLYSMKLKSKGYNIRVLYSYSDRGKLLINSFYEKAGKRNTEYKKYAEIALERRKELIEQKVWQVLI